MMHQLTNLVTYFRQLETSSRHRSTAFCKKWNVLTISQNKKTGKINALLGCGFIWFAFS